MITKNFDVIHALFQLIIFNNFFLSSVCFNSIKVDQVHFFDDLLFKSFESFESFLAILAIIHDSDVINESIDLRDFKPVVDNRNRMDYC